MSSRDRVGRVAWALCLSMPSLVSGRARAATPLAVSLRYEVDPSLNDCPAEEEFRRRVVDQLGDDPFLAGAGHHVVASVRQSEPGLSGAIVWTDASGANEGERTLSSANRDCVEFVRGMTFALAVQIQFLNQLLGTTRAPAPSAREIAPASSAPPVQRATFAAGLGPIVALGETPGPSAGGELFVAARARAFSLALAARAILPVTWRQADGTGFRASALAATLALCGHWRRLALCPAVMLGRLRVTGLGVDDARSPASTMAGVGLRAALEHALSTRFAAVLHADGAATLTTRTVYLNELPVWKTPTLSVTAGVDLAVSFP